MYEVERESFVPHAEFILSDNVQKQLVTAASGQLLLTGRIIKMNAGKAVADDGADVNLVYGIMANNVDATDGDKEGYCYTFGTFNQSAIIFPEGKTYADYREALRNKGIVLENVQAAINK